MKARGIGVGSRLLMAAVLVCCVWVVTWRFLPSSTGIGTEAATPSYRAIAQLHVAFLDVRTDLLLLEAGAAVSHEQLSRHVDILTSKIDVVAQPSELHDRYERIHEFKENAAQLAAFSTSTLSLLASTKLSEESASFVLTAFNKLYPRILALSDNAWLQGQRDGEGKRESIDWQSAKANGVILLLVLALAGATILLGRDMRALRRT
jgi:hypothetical protein